MDAFTEQSALRSRGTGDDPDRTYDYGRLRTEVHKAGNFLSHQGVRDGRTLGVADDGVPEVVLAFLGAALTGAVVRFDPPDAFDGRAVLAPVAGVADYDLPPGGRRVAYGGAPDDPATVHFEEETWSENPTFPPPRVETTDPLLATADEVHSHGTIVDAAAAIAREFDLAREGTSVAVRTSLARPGAVAALSATLFAGATVLLPGADGRVGTATGANSDTDTDGDAVPDDGLVGTHVVAPPGVRVPEIERIDPAQWL